MFGWVNFEQNLEATCEELEGWHEEVWDDNGQDDYFRMQLTDDSNEYVHPHEYSPYAVLTDADGLVIQPESDWSQSEWRRQEISMRISISVLESIDSTVDSGYFDVEISEAEDEEQEAHIGHLTLKTIEFVRTKNNWKVRKRKMLSSICSTKFSAALTHLLGDWVQVQTCTCLTSHHLKMTTP